MQTTLLSVAIALIVALVAALIGPLMIDWGRFRPSIEAEATRLIGAPVRVTGAIEASILPSPVLVLRGLEVGPSHAGSSIRARSLQVEMSLGSLMRGRWRAQELHLIGPDFNLGIDAAGQLALPPIAPGFDPDHLSIERLNIEDGHAVLADSRSGSRVTLDKLWFNGDVRSLTGPFKGDGAFVVGGDLYAYRVTAGRAEQSALKLRLNIDPLEKPLALEADGTLSFTGTVPRFDGGLTLSRPAGVVLRNGQTFASDPWRLSSKVKANPVSALFEAVEFQYGPEERAVRLTGTAELKFGDKPRFDGILSATQIDLDRAFATANAGRQLPFVALKTLGDSFSGAIRPTVPARIGVSIDTLTLAGATIQNVRGDLRSDGEAWNLDGFELRVPGFSQVNLSGRLDLAPGRLGFTGPVSVDSTDPSTLVAWLEGRNTQAVTRMKPFRARGDVTLASERIAFDRLSAEIDRKWVAGRFAYAWAAGEKPARLDADLNAADLDIDALMSFADAARGATTFETPREVTLGLGIGRAVVAGLTASNISARFRRDPSGLHVERLSIGDIGGNSLNISGQIDTTASPPQGALNGRLDARNLSGVTALAEKFVPEFADGIRRVAQRLPQAQINGTLTMERTGAVKLVLDGRSGDLRLGLRGETTPATEAAAGELINIRDGNLRLEAKVDSERAAALVDLLNLGSLVAVEGNRPGQFNLAASGSLDRLAIDASLRAGSLEASAKGSANLRAEEPQADLRLSVTGADARPLRRVSRASDPLMVSLSSNLMLTGHSIALDDFFGTIAGVAARGKLAVNFTDVPRIDGRIEADQFDTRAALAALIGTPPAEDARGWTLQPFTKGVLDGVEGRIEVRAGRVAITPTLALNQAHAWLNVSRSEVAFTEIDGGLADGEFKGQVAFQRRGEGLSFNGRMQLHDADAAVLLADSNRAVTGRVALQIDVEGLGLSPRTLVGSLNGNGLLSISQAQFAALDARVFETSTQAVDRGLALDMRKIAEVAGNALDGGALAVAAAEGVVTIAQGQIRVTNLMTRAEGADLTMTASVDLAEQNLSARLALSGGGAGQAGSDQPGISVFLNGPIASPKRTVDVSALTAWLTLRAVDRQTKQLDAMEARRRAAAAPADVSSGHATDAPPAMPAQAEAPPLPPAIEVPPLPDVVDQKPARAQTKPRGTAVQPRPNAVKPPLSLLPASPHD